MSIFVHRHWLVGASAILMLMNETFRPTRRDVLRMGTVVLLSEILASCTKDPLEQVLRQATLRCEAGLEAAREPIRLTLVNDATATQAEKDQFRYGADIHNLDYYLKSGFAHDDQLSAGPSTYVISEIVDADIVSRDFFDCIGSVFVGKEKGTQKQLAFAVHADPSHILELNRTEFVKDYAAQLDSFIARVEPSSIAYTFLGGKYRHEEYEKLKDADDAPGAHDQDLQSVMHVRALVLQAAIAMEKLPHLMPSAIVGPTMYRGPISMRFSPNGSDAATPRELKVLTVSTLLPGYSLCSLKEYLVQLENDLKKR